MPKYLTPRLGLYLLLLAMAVMAMVVARSCSRPALGPRSEGASGGDTLNVAIELSPRGLCTHGDTLAGTYYDMLRQMAARHGRPLRFTPFTRLADALDGLLRGRFQLVAADIPVTAQMKRKVLFLDPLDAQPHVLVQLPDTLTGALPYPDELALGGDTVHLPEGSPLVPRVLNLGREIGDTIHIASHADYSPEQLVILTATGSLPNTIVTLPLARRLKDAYPAVDISVHVSMRQFHAWALAPGDTLLRDTLNAWLSQLPRP